MRIELRLFDPGNDSRGHDILGFTHFKGGTARIYVSRVLNSDNRRLTLIHELLHVLEFTRGLDSSELEIELQTTEIASNANDR